MTTETGTRTGVLVVGGGPGGYVAAIRASQLGREVTLVEKDAVGGVCLNHGCIPSKALVTGADLATTAGNAEELGIDADLTVDLGRMVEWKDGVVERLTGGVERLCRANGVEFVAGRAEFVDSGTVAIHGDDALDRIGFEEAVIATGSRPMTVPRFDFAADPVWSSRDALAATSVPDRLLVVGAGYIGMELSTVYAKLGSEVTVLEALDGILPTYGDDVAGIVRQRASELGVTFRFGEAAQEWTGTDDGIRVTTETGDGNETEYAADRVLVAVGREPVTEGLGLTAIGVETDEDGFVVTDRRGRTSADGVYAIGDVAGEPMLAHAASTEGIVAAHDIAGEPLEGGDRIVPAAVFTDPEIATVGLTEREAEAAGFDPLVGRMPFDASGRALTANEREGFVRVVADERSHGLLGAQVVGPEASELVAELAFAVTQRATLEDLAETVHVHPTLAETTMEAAEQALGRAIHTTN